MRGLLASLNLRVISNCAQTLDRVVSRDSKLAMCGEQVSRPKF
jgi:hypothetical protein